MLQQRRLSCAAASTSSGSTPTTSRRALHFAAARRRTRPRLHAAAVDAQQAPPTAASVSVRPLSGESELWAVARLRADAYHEDDTSRFAATFKKQFAEREAASLRQRTAAAAGGVRCECLVALEGGEGDDEADKVVVGCIDLRPPPHGAATPSTSGVPLEDAAEGAYLLNVVVAERSRGKGTGEALMRAALQRARSEHRARRAYTHVEAGNGAAARLYARCGFKEAGEESGALAGAAELGRVLLLCADLGELA
jgi:RimJ/RimL family protein N-acetyltransferase